MNIFIPKDILRALKRHDSLLHDNNLFLILRDRAVKPSIYWDLYISRILLEIKRNQLCRFGRNYDLTRGFGDAMSYPFNTIKETRLKTRIQKILKLKILYVPAEKLLTDFRTAKKRKNLYLNNFDLFTDHDFLDYFTVDIADTTYKLGINKYFLMAGRDIPWSYIQPFVYFKLINEILKQNSLTLKDYFDGNVIDIGGGYGSFLDTIFLYKNYYKVGIGSINYILDQFPVTYIANQYLKFRHGDALLPPISSSFSSDQLDAIQISSKYSQYLRVIQNNLTKDIKDLNIKFFFNSNSFQEMSQEQIEEYMRFIARNKAKSSIIACFFYAIDRNALKNNALNILSQNFKLIGSSSYLGNGLVKGTMYLFSP
jgi:putative sugar O-methyltransferase